MTPWIPGREEGRACSLRGGRVTPISGGQSAVRTSNMLLLSERGIVFGQKQIVGGGKTFQLNLQSLYLASREGEKS